VTGHPAIALVDVTEKAFQTQVIKLAQTRGFIHYHTWRSVKSPSGFPDLVLVGRGRVVFLELKREKGQPTDRQVHWLAALRNAGAEVYIARPRHLQALATVLGPTGTQAWHEARGVLLFELDQHLEARAA
jgi:hypothetical protein